MRWLVTGANGMLGQDLTDTLRSAGHEVTGVDLPEVDITQMAQVQEAIAGCNVVVNCAAYTAVDPAEDNEALAFSVNAVGPQVLARAARQAGARIVHISTDYVFDGHATRPYEETQLAAPRSAYGRTKVAGEWALRAETDDYLLLRTAWLYGAQGKCFPKTIARVARERGSLTVVADEVGQPTWTRDVADLIVRLVEASAPSGIYHATSEGECSWYEFAAAILAAAGLDPSISRPTTAAEYQAKAPRPSYSVLSHAALTDIGVAPIGPWLERWELAAGEVLA